jgi:ubiquinone/menaquinone biosynthesis C-methylase UbiE
VTVYREDGDDFLAHRVDTYDLITAVQSLRYSPDQLATLKRAYRALKPGGILLVDMVVNLNMPLIDAQGKFVDPKELEKKLLEAGYPVAMKVKSDVLNKYAGYSFAVKKTADKPRLKLPIRLVKIPELELDYMDLIDTEYRGLGQLLPYINYVYQLTV